jgi:long-chain acyl-CoA synthetase
VDARFVPEERKEQGMETIGGMLKSRVEKYGDRVMMKKKVKGAWEEFSWNEFYSNVRDLGLAMISMGIQAGDRIAVFATNSPEWQMIDMAALSIGAANVPLYPTITAPQAEYIFKDSGSRIVFVGTEDHMNRVLQVKGNLPDLMKIVTIDNTSSDNPDVLTFDEMIEVGEDYADRGEFDRRLDKVQLDDLCSIVYTSGTTGPPKGVMLTHKNFMSNVTTASDLITVYENDICLSFLPLSHVLERMSGYYTSIFNGVTIAHAQSMDTLLDDIGDIKPHFMVSVPRLYEKVHAGVLANIESESPLKQKIFHWAAGVGGEVSKLITGHKPIPAGLKFKYKIANKLVFSKIYERMGGRLRFFFSGGAPLAKEIAEFFHAMGITILEGYGLTETSPVLTVNTPERLRFGSVGQPIPEVEIKIAEDGEILAKGPNVMKGYFNKPEATAEVLVDGWFHTGDIGYLDEDNYLHITDRKKDLIVTAGGKNIAPQNIENQLKLDKYIEQACVIGDKRKYLSALIVPNFEELEAWAKKEGISCPDRMGLVLNDRVNQLIRERIDEQLKEFDRHEGITKFTLLPQEMTEADGFLTPTLKVKRKEVSQVFADDINKMYSE